MLVFCLVRLAFTGLNEFTANLKRNHQTLKFFVIKKSRYQPHLKHFPQIIFDESLHLEYSSLIGALLSAP